MGSARAFYIARSGRPGPVVLDFAKNAQVDMTDYEPVTLISFAVMIRILKLILRQWLRRLP